MIRSPLRAGLALACALSLSACGGSDGDVFISGTVTGYTKAGLALTNNDGPRYDVPVGTSFTFPQLVETDASYNVKVVAVPSNVERIEDCKVTGGSGKAVFTITTIRVACTIRTHALTVNVIGLGDAKGLVLVNGADRKEVPATGADGTFEMGRVTEDVAYGVSILQQPTGRQCTVENASGTMRESDINNVVVRCVQ